MFYIMYLTGLCNRRHWPQPQFKTYRVHDGYSCVVRVNNREYSTSDIAYETEALARNAAATRAYMICRNFSVNDGMYPGMRPGQGELGLQGLPVAIGAGRRGGKRRGTADTEDEVLAGSVGTISEGSFSSGGESPRSVDNGMNIMEKMRGETCRCRRAEIRRYGHCVYCLREAGWT